MYKVRKIKQGNIVVNPVRSTKNIQAGNYNATIKNVKLKPDQSTSYGFKDILDVEVEIDLGVTTITKKSSYYISDSINSRFSRFIDDMKLAENEEIDLDDLIGKRVILTIENKTVDGITYSNIEKIVPYETNEEVI